MRAPIHSDSKLVSDWFEFIRIDFRPFFVERDTKRLSDWFEMTQNGSETDFGMASLTKVSD